MTADLHLVPKLRVVEVYLLYTFTLPLSNIIIFNEGRSPKTVIGNDILCSMGTALVFQKGLLKMISPFK
jgi:drug/metabolite transporter (DMT)-like permease